MGGSNNAGQKRGEPCAWARQVRNRGRSELRGNEGRECVPMKLSTVGISAKLGDCVARIFPTQVPQVAGVALSVVAPSRPDIKSKDVKLRALK